MLCRRGASGDAYTAAMFEPLGPESLGALLAQADVGALGASALALFFVLGVVFVASGTQGFLGFGFGMMAMTGLTLSFDLVHAAGVVNVTGLLVNLGVFFALRGAILWGHLRWIAPAIAVGVVGGVFALGSFPAAGMVRLLGVTIVAIAAWNLVAPRLPRPRSRSVDVSVGVVSGVLGGAFNTGGPPLVAHLYSTDHATDRIKATIQALFMVIGLARIPIAAAQGLMAPAVFVDSALLMPVVLLGVATGVRLGRRVPAERFRRVAWFALGALGLMLAAGA